MDLERLKYQSDIELVSNYKSTNDKVYVGELYKRYTHLVYGMCIFYFKDKNQASDSTIEIFEKLFVELKKREVENFKNWLSFVVRNYCISELRKQQTAEHLKEKYTYELKTHIHTEENKKEEEKLITKLENAIQQLNPLQRKCIELFYYKKMSYHQIVEITGYTSNDVKSYIQNAKRNLKLILTNNQY